MVEAVLLSFALGAALAFLFTVLALVPVVIGALGLNVVWGISHGTDAGTLATTLVASWLAIQAGYLVAGCCISVGHTLSTKARSLAHSAVSRRVGPVASSRN